MKPKSTIAEVGFYVVAPAWKSRYVETGIHEVLASVNSFVAPPGVGLSVRARDELGRCGACVAQRMREALLAAADVIYPLPKKREDAHREARRLRGLFRDCGKGYGGSRYYRRATLILHRGPVEPGSPQARKFEEAQAAALAHLRGAGFRVHLSMDHGEVELAPQGRWRNVCGLHRVGLR